MADTALAAGVSGPPRLIISHLEARNFLAREIEAMTKTALLHFYFVGTNKSLQAI